MTTSSGCDVISLQPDPLRIHILEKVDIPVLMRPASHLVMIALAVP